MSYRMLRKRQNPSPNWADKLMFEIYARFGLFIPLVAFVSFWNNIGMPHKTASPWTQPAFMVSCVMHCNQFRSRNHDYFSSHFSITLSIGVMQFNCWELDSVIWSRLVQWCCWLLQWFQFFLQSSHRMRKSMKCGKVWFDTFQENSCESG